MSNWRRGNSGDSLKYTLRLFVCPLYLYLYFLYTTEIFHFRLALVSTPRRLSACCLHTIFKKNNNNNKKNPLAEIDACPFCVRFQMYGVVMAELPFKSH